MTRTNESVFSMFLKVRNFYPLHLVEIDLMPIISQYFQEMESRTEEILMADAGGRADLTGVALMKGRLRGDLEQIAQKVSNGVAAHAVVQRDVVLQKRIDFNKSKWYVCSEEELITQAKITLGLAKPLEKDLAPYGVKASDVTKLDQHLDHFVDNISGTSLAIDQRKNDNAKVIRLMNSTRKFLNEELDVMMRIFEVDNPDLYQMYLSARAIDINGPVKQPTAVVEVAPKAVAQAFTAPYKDDTLFTLRNPGAEIVFFSLSAKNTEAGSTEVALYPGETRSRLAKNLAPSGTFLMLRNEGESSTSIKIWVE